MDFVPFQLDLEALKRERRKELIKWIALAVIISAIGFILISAAF